MDSLILSMRIERRWPVQALLGVALLWAVIAVVVGLRGLTAAPGIGELVALLLQVLPPVAMALVAYALLPGSGDALPLAPTEARLDAVRTALGGLGIGLDAAEAQMASASERALAFASAAGSNLPHIAETLATLDATAAQAVGKVATMRDAVAAAAALLPDIGRSAAEIEATVRALGADSGARLQGIDAMLASLMARSREAETAGTASLNGITALLARIDEASSRNTAALAKRAYALDAAVDGVLERTAQTVDLIRAQLAAELEQVAAGVASASDQLGGLGDDVARRINQRIEALVALSTQAAEAIVTQQAGATELHQSAGRQIDDLLERLDRLASHADGAGEAIMPRLAAMDGQIGGVIGQLRDAEAAAGGLAAETSGLGETVGSVADTLAGRIEAARATMAQLGADAANATAHVGELGVAVGAGAESLAAAAGRFAAERTAVDDNAAALMGHFDAAAARLAAIGVDTAALTASTTANLADALTRITAAAEAAAAALRTSLAEIAENAETRLAAVSDNSAASASETGERLAAELARITAGAEAAGVAMQADLARVVDAAVARLTDSAAQGVETAFAAPLEARLAGVHGAAMRAGAAGDAAAQRLSGSMLRLVEVIGAIETHIDRVESRHLVRARDSMAAGATRLIESLRAGVVDLAELLAIDIGADVWKRYLAGDSSAFAHAVVPRLDRDMTLRVERLYAHDPAFAAEATRFLGRFDDLVGRLVGDRDGEALAAMALTSDLGKIYVVLAEAAGRMPPSRAGSAAPGRAMLS